MRLTRPSQNVRRNRCAEDDVLLARRRPRSPDDPAIWAAHMLVGASGTVKIETDRAEFLGRGNTVHAPDALRSAN